MGKGTISKKSRAPSLHSRAARRATSPGIDTDKSLKNARPPTDDNALNQRPAVLAAHHGGGVTKKKVRGRKAVPSARARRRHDKAMDRASAVLERTAQKAARSREQARVLNARRRPWDEVNQAAAALLAESTASASASGKHKKAPGSARGAEEDDNDDAVDAFYADTDEEMDEPNPEPEPEAQVDESRAQNTDAGDGGVPMPIDSASTAHPPPPDEEGEIL